MYNDFAGAISTSLIAELPEHQRPRERLRRCGPAALSDVELLAILLRTGANGCSALDLARLILRNYNGRISRLAQASVEELCTIRGVGIAKATQIRAAFALAQRLQQWQEPQRVRLHSPADVADYMRESLRGKQQEEFHVLFVDIKHYLLKSECITIGLLDRSHVHAREVFRSAIRESCARLILAHNHPSGDPTPSSQDIACTRNLQDAGKLIGIDVLDHVVIGQRSAERSCDYLSMREAGLLEKPDTAC